MQMEKRTQCNLNWASQEWIYLTNSNLLFPSFYSSSFLEPDLDNINLEKQEWISCINHVLWCKGTSLHNHFREIFWGHCWLECPQHNDPVSDVSRSKSTTSSCNNVQSNQNLLRLKQWNGYVYSIWQNGLCYLEITAKDKILP